MKKRKPIRFTARLPALISKERQHMRITRKAWEVLLPECRDQFVTPVTICDPRKKRRRIIYRTVYQQILVIAPYPNPAVIRLRSKLKRQRVQWQESLELDNGVAFITFTTH